MQTPLIDPFARAISYLRVSVTDRCDFRCAYCMTEHMTFLPKAELLTLEELDRLCSAFVGMGVQKLRITGGEPLVRKGIMTFFEAMARHLQSGALKDQPYGFQTRFEDAAGTNPEELIAAAHASCFTMALSFKLAEAGHTDGSVETEAKVTLEKGDDGFAVTRSALSAKAKVPGLDQAKFEELAADAKANCPISKLLKADITLETAFEG